VLAAVLNLLAADRLRMRDLFQLVKTNEVAVESLRAFDAMLATLINVNCPEDYKFALATAGFSQ
jgi:molybdopterin-guanine dinucleotide biosynthesis protein A